LTTYSLYIGKFINTSHARLFVWFGVLLNLGVLFSFKYVGFLVQNINLLLPADTEPISISVHLPIGISFFTFQALTYILDVYRGIVPAQRNLVNIALYISLFPQLIAGPIVRYHDINSQITNRENSLVNLQEGISRFIVGLGKKILIANPMGEIADLIMNIPGDQLSASVAWLGISCYTLQIYFDFSGYSDMAIGLGRMFGFKFLENFRYPYVSRSVQEFWTRWHISLSNWFKDYLYIPLGGNRISPVRTYINLCLVFFLCGLWHGASWNFVFWGMIHGAFLVFERMGLGKFLQRIWIPLRHSYLIFIVMVGWVFFKLDTVPKAFEYLGLMMGVLASNTDRYSVAFFMDTEKTFIFFVGVVLCLPVLDCLKVYWGKFQPRIMGNPSKSCILARTGMEVIALALILALSIIYLSAGTYNPFIYSRF
jgi:alginate O-acetyltransferase complex protein AlgI